MLAAEQLGDRLGLGAEPRGGCAPRRSPADFDGPACSPRWACRWSTGSPGAGIASAIRRDASSSALPDRLQTVSALAGAMAPDVVRNRSGNSSRPLTSAPRKRVDRLVGVADDDQVAAVARRVPAAAAPGRGRCPGTRRRRPPGSGRAAVAHRRLLGEQHRPVHQLGVVEGALGVEHVEVLAEERRPARPSPRGPRGRPARRAGRGRGRPRGPGSAARAPPRPGPWSSAPRAAWSATADRGRCRPRSRSRRATSCSAPLSSRSGSA